MFHSRARQVGQGGGGALATSSRGRRNAQRRQCPSGPGRVSLRRAAAEDVAVDAEPAETAASAEQQQQQPAKLALDDIAVGQTFDGVVVNIVPFGCFVDIGATTDGMVHISQLSNEYSDTVDAVVSKGNKVQVHVLSVDKAGNRISLSMKDPNQEQSQAGDTGYGDEDQQGGGRRQVPRRSRTRSAGPSHSLTVGDKVSGVVTRIAGFGAFIKMEDGFEALLHRDNMRVEGALNAEPSSLFSEGDAVDDLTVIRVDGDKVALSNVSESDVGQDSEMADSGMGPMDIEAERRDAGSQFVISLAALGIDLDALPSKDGSKPARSAPASAPAATEPAPAPAAPQAGGPELGGVAAGAAVSHLAGDLVSKDIPEVEANLGQGVLDQAAPTETTAPLDAEPMPEVEAKLVPEAAPEAPAAPAKPEDVAPSELPAAGAVAVPERSAAPEAPAAAAPAMADADAPAVPPVPEAAPERVPEAAPELVADAAPEAADEAPDAGPDAQSPVALTEPAAVAAEAAEPQPAAASAAAAAPDAPAASSASVAPPALVKELRAASGAGMMDCKKALLETGGDVGAAKEWLRAKGLAQAAKKAGRIAAEGAVMSYIHTGARLGVLVEVNCETDFVARGDRFKEFAADIAMQVAACDDVRVVSPDDVSSADVDAERAVEMEKEDLQKKPADIRSKIVDGRLAKFRNTQALTTQPFIKAEDGSSVESLMKQLTAEIGEKISIRRFVRYKLGEGVEKREDDFAAEVAAQTEQKIEAPPAPAPAAEAEATPRVAVDPKLVKQLRDASGAGMMKCKEALATCNNDMTAAQDWLKKKGLASAGKKAGRIAAEGVIEAYVHAGNAKGVLLELNCETDFVAKGEPFKELASDLAMQVVAFEDVAFVSADDVPQEFKDAERAAEMQKEDILSKPEAIRGNIVEGRVKKTVAQACLLDQPFIKDTKKTVDQVIKEAIAKLGENIKVRRFERFNLGEGIEKKSEDFAAEVAAQTGQA